MNTLLTIIAIASLIFAAIAFAIFRSKLTRWLRYVLITPVALIATFGLYLFVGILWEHYRYPTETSVVSELRKIANNKDQSAILAGLKQHGYSPDTYHEQFSVDASYQYGFSPAVTSNSVSYIQLNDIRIRPHDLFNESLFIAFLFDSKKQLITWGYWIYSPTL